MAMPICRCPWVLPDHPLYIDYHDTEWGVPSYDPGHLFEMLCLEGAQAGLSWWTILQKREHYRKVFRGFDPVRVARMTDASLEELVTDPGIVRHRGKIFAFRSNAQAWLELDDPVAFLWSFVNGEPVVNRPARLGDYQAVTSESQAISKALKKAGFNFVGPTICHAFMQACGMVDDHSADCFKAR